MRQTERDILVLGFSDDTRALLEHLRAEAPALVERITIIDGRPDTIEGLHRAGIAAVYGDPLDPGVLQRAGMDRATMVVRLDLRGPGFSELGPLVQQLSPQARLLLSRSGTWEVSPVGAGPSGRGDGAARPLEPRKLWGLLTTWQFWLLVGVAVVDTAVPMLPVASAALLIATLSAPRCLRWVARFLDALAERR